MFFRFMSALGIVVAIAVAGIQIEKQNLELRRKLSRQQYRLDVLTEEHARLRLATQQLGTPERLLESMKAEQLRPAPSHSEQQDDTASRNRPLLRWQRALPSTN